MARKKTVNPLQKKIDRLTAEVARQREELAEFNECNVNLIRLNATANGELEQLHTLLDQQAGAPPREYTVAGTTYTPNVTARLMAWLAHR